MALKSGNTDLYPLEISKIVSENRIIYDRTTRGKNYFYLAINADPGVYFITSDGFYLTTSDRDMFLVR